MKHSLFSDKELFTSVYTFFIKNVKSIYIENLTLT